MKEVVFDELKAPVASADASPVDDSADDDDDIDVDDDLFCMNDEGKEVLEATGKVRFAEHQSGRWGM